MIQVSRRLFSILTIVFLSAFVGLPQILQAQTPSASKLSVHWEELTASDFRDGIHRSLGNVPAALRHPREARPAPAARHRSS